MLPWHMQRLPGQWHDGWALDFHTAPGEPGSYRRTPLGEALYRLKYRQDRTQAEPIARAVGAVLSELGLVSVLSGIIPVPPSETARPFQPVAALADRIGVLTGLTVLHNALVKVKATPKLKDLSDTNSRRQVLRGAFQADREQLAGRVVLLFDDLYRSGETLAEATRTLQEQGRVQRVYVLTVTRTRVLR
jgi:competence protein ComFC